MYSLYLFDIVPIGSFGGLFMLLFESAICSFWQLCSRPLHEYITLYLSIFLYLVLWVISSLDLLQIKLLQNSYAVLYVHIYFHFLQVNIQTYYWSQSQYTFNSIANCFLNCYSSVQCMKVSVVLSTLYQSKSLLSCSCFYIARFL